MTAARGRWPQPVEDGAGASDLPIRGPVGVHRPVADQFFLDRTVHPACTADAPATQGYGPHTSWR
eukprot:scaffold146299_cov39-Tisochrysis_lutea.AAC.2